MQNQVYKTGDTKTDQLIADLVNYCALGERAEIFREILTTAVKFAQSSKDMGDYKLINTSLKELRHALRIFSPYRDKQKVIIFGSARTPEHDGNYQLACGLAAALIRHGFMVISGAGGGIMEAANRGAGRDNSFGININLPAEQCANPYIQGDPKLMTFKYFFTRKLMFIKESNATVLMPGGFGTLDEGFENLTLFQTGKCMPRPIVLLEEKGGSYWKNWLEYVNTSLLMPGYINPEDFKLFSMADSVDAAVNCIINFYKVFHSLRYVRKLTVIRLRQPVSQQLLERLNTEYADIVREGRIELTGPLEEEKLRNEHLEYPRLVFNFRKNNFGRLNEMIRLINQETTDNDQ